MEWTKIFPTYIYNRMKTSVLTFISALLVVLIDSIYLNTTSAYFSKQIQSVQKNPLKLNLTATVLCYIFIIFALNYFIIRKRASVSDAFLLGFAIYGIFEFTNMALFEKWKWTTVVLDTNVGEVSCLHSLPTSHTHLETSNDRVSLL